MVWEAALHQTNDLGCQTDRLSPEIYTHNAKRLMKSTENSSNHQDQHLTLVAADTTLSPSEHQ